MLDLKIRLATMNDLPAINAIYNYYVTRSTCTYQMEHATSAERETWFNGHGPKHPVTVAVLGDEVVGWGSLSQFHSRCAYQHTVENSVYVRHDQIRRGIGQALLQDLIIRARDLGHHTIVALISADQSASIALHARFGFRDAGRLRQVGRKFNQWLDVAYMQLML